MITIKMVYEYLNIFIRPIHCVGFLDMTFNWTQDILWEILQIWKRETDVFPTILQENLQKNWQVAQIKAIRKGILRDIATSDTNWT